MPLWRPTLRGVGCVFSCVDHLTALVMMTMNPSALTSSSLDMSSILRALRGEIGGWALRGLLNHALMILLYRRIGEVCGKMERLVARFQAGRLWRRAPRASAERKPTEVAPTKTARIWPVQSDWLVRRAAYQAVGYGLQLQTVLQRPEMVELLKAAPQAARILAPICRMLAIDTAVLRPGEPPVVPKVREVKAPRVKAPRKRRVFDCGRIPLPRGVLSAARRRGFGKF